jgi:cysteine desulfurase
MVYFDNAAAMPADSAALEDFCRFAHEFPANQEAIHDAGYTVRKRLEQAERELVEALTPDASQTVQVMWSHTGSDAIRCTIDAINLQGGNIVTSKLEHPALLAALKRTPAEIRYVKITSNGLADLKSLRELVDSETRLVTLFHAQSETGAKHNSTALKQISTIINEQGKNAEFMLDTIQSAGKIAIPWNDAKLDYIFVSGHKIGAPGGAAVITRNKAIHDNYLKLRHQEYLTGRVEPATILAMVETIKRRSAKGFYQERVGKLNLRLRELLSAMPPKIKPVITTEFAEASEYILHCRLPGFQSAVIVRMLSEAGFAVSSGSACAAEAGGPSAALTAMGFKRDDAYSGLRISFSEKNTLEEVESLIETLQRVLSDY